MTEMNNRSIMQLIDAMPPGEEKEYLLARWTRSDLPRDVWESIRRGDQTPPADDYWDTWIYSGGRGAGKTRTGVEEVCAVAESAKDMRILIVAPNKESIRDTIVEGESGILARYRSYGDERAIRAQSPEYSPSIRRMKWKNGSSAFILAADELLEHYSSGHQSSALRGVQAHFSWAEEIGDWKVPEDYGTTDELTLWDEIRFSTRLGMNPRVLATTTPQDTPMNRLLQKHIQRDPVSTRLTEAASALNYHNMSTNFMERLEKIYGDTPMAQTLLKGRWPYPH